MRHERSHESEPEPQISCRHLVKVDDGPSLKDIAGDPPEIEKRHAGENDEHAPSDQQCDSRYRRQHRVGDHKRRSHLFPIRLLARLSMRRPSLWL